jgi:hypothetical protein
MKCTQPIMSFIEGWFVFELEITLQLESQN